MTLTERTKVHFWVIPLAALFSFLLFFVFSRLERQAFGQGQSSSASVIAVATSSVSIAHPVAMFVNGVDGVWFERKEAQILLREHQSYPHLLAVETLCDAGQATADDLSRTTSTALSLMSSSITSCEQALASCQADKGSFFTNPVVDLAGGILLGTGLCAAAGKLAHP